MSSNGILIPQSPAFLLYSIIYFNATLFYIGTSIEGQANDFYLYLVQATYWLLKSFNYLDRQSTSVTTTHYLP